MPCGQGKAGRQTDVQRRNAQLGFQRCASASVDRALQQPLDLGFDLIGPRAHRRPLFGRNVLQSAEERRELTLLTQVLDP